MGCTCAIKSDQYHGFECEIVGGGCMFMRPDSKLCAAMFGEGPDADAISQGDKSVRALLAEDPTRKTNCIWTD